jgi:hypothetical protein
MSLLIVLLLVSLVNYEFVCGSCEFHTPYLLQDSKNNSLSNHDCQIGSVIYSDRVRRERSFEFKVKFSIPEPRKGRIIHSQTPSLVFRVS